MNQFISEDIISKELESYGYMGYCTTEFHEGFRDGVKFAEKHLMWVSVTTNSPEEHEDVLLTNGRDYFVGYVGFNVVIYDHTGTVMSDVTHWMYLLKLNK